jgi:hypothetical protein
MAGSEFRRQPSHEIRRYSRPELASMAAEYALIVVQAPGGIASALVDLDQGPAIDRQCNAGNEIRFI